MNKRINKRDVMLSLAHGEKPPYTPAAFFLHFDPAFHRGEAAVDKHLEFFRATDMDFVKVQYEQRQPPHARVDGIWKWWRGEVSRHSKTVARL